MPPCSSLHPAPYWATLPVVKTLCLLLSLLLLSASSRAEPEQHPFVLYAEFKQETPVELTDGAQWVMDAGDCFPIYMFKDHQSKVILQLGSSTFTTEASRVRVLKDSDGSRALLAYRKTLESYLNSKAENWKKGASTTAAPVPPAIPLR